MRMHLGGIRHPERRAGLEEALKERGVMVERDVVDIGMDDWMRLLEEFPVIGAPDQVLPPLWRQAANLAGAVGRVAAAAVTGNPVSVPAEVEGARGGYCAVCPFWMAEKGRCSRCGCLGMKLSLATERCPVGYWERWERI